MSNLKNIVLIFQENPIARSYLKLFKYHTDQNFYHIHHGYLKKVRGADATLHSIDKFNEIGASFFKMDKKIDNGKIIKKFKKKYNKLSFPNNEQFENEDLYNIWYAFFDPALRASLLKRMLNENTDLKVFEIDNLDLDDNNYSYFEKKKIKKLFKDKIFA